MPDPTPVAGEPQRFLCDVIVNNGFGEPTECGRSIPCALHSWLRDNCVCSESHIHPRDLTPAMLERALNEALSSYDNNWTWASGELVIETAEAGGFMGSASSYRNIDRQEFSKRMLNALVACEAASPAALDVRPQVASFASLMERVLRDNDHKGGWQDCRPSWLLARLKQEVDELDEAMRKGTDVAREAADVANFALMIVDVLNAHLAQQKDEDEDWGANPGKPSITGA